MTYAVMLFDTVGIYTKYFERILLKPEVCKKKKVAKPTCKKRLKIENLYLDATILKQFSQKRRSGLNLIQLLAKKILTTYRALLRG